MAFAKKWYGYPRPILFDELQQSAMVEKYRRENKMRLDWHRKYGKTRTQLVEGKNKSE